MIFCALGFLFVAPFSAMRAQEVAVTNNSPSIAYVSAAPVDSAAPSVELNPASDSNLHSVTTGQGNEVSAEPRRFQYGLRLSIRGVYDDNIEISQSNRVSDYYVAIEPGVTVGFGDIVGHQDNYLRLDYVPSIILFLDHTDNDAVQHLFHLEGHHRFSHLDLTLGQDIQILDGADLGTAAQVTTPDSHVNLDVSARTRLNIYTTHLGASYDLTGKTFLSSALAYAVSDYHSLISSEVLTGNLFINYNYSDKLVVGVGGTGGFDMVDDPNPNQTFEQANARVTYRATGKVSLNASGGVEFRQFEDSSRGQYISPVFEIGAAFQPFDGTNLSLSVNRRTLNSAVFAGQDFASTNVTASARQRLLSKFSVGLAVGYENSNYFSAVSGVNASRNDNYYFAEPSVDVSITRFWTFGAYYLHRQNESSFNSFSFYDNQVGVRAALAF